jgi:hypothetical protein
MPEWVRVTDKDTGHKLTVLKSEVANGNYTELKADAVNANGDPLAPEFKSNQGQQAEGSK